MSADDYIFEDPCESMDRSQEEDYVDNTHSYKYIGRRTEKAKFFVTDDRAGLEGFWCPNAAIENLEMNEVTVASWCDIKYINFV